MFKDKTLLITGGTGTFGNAVVKRYLKTDIKEIRIFSRDEKKQEDMRNEVHDSRLNFFIGDVRDGRGLCDAMRGVDYTFHAAALKQVPSCEFFPLEAVRTNTLGADNVFAAAAECEVKNVVALSTDKAVYPINAMGMSKALMEKLMRARARGYISPVFCATRYGNVMASRGSVIPLFIDQIKSGNPITITNPEMTRFMMTIEDAVDLVIYAFQNGKPGDIFVKKAPAAAVLTIAEALKDIFAARNEIKVIGTRHGEKLYETLITREEMSETEDCGSYYRIPMDTRGMNYSLYFNEGHKASVEEYTSHNTHRMGKEETTGLLQRLDCVKEALR